MKHRFAVAVWLPVALLACAAGTAPSRDAAAPSGAPLLWRADPGDGGGPLFLFGSVHVGTPQSLDLNGPIRRAWEGSEELVVEVDLTQVSPEEMTRATLRYGMLPEGETLEQRVGSDTWTALAARLETQGLPPAAFSSFKPWLAALYLEVMKLQASGLDPQFGVDRQMLGRAVGAKPIVELESYEFQFAMLDSLSPEVQAMMLEEGLSRYEEGLAETSEIHDAWLQGDEQALIELIYGHVEEYPEYAEKVFFERNEAMTERLAELSRDGKTRFAVVGAGHMVGPRGIPSLLEERGFQVERMR